jgi:RNA polymerase sigma-70 factor (ECF subfamily)
MDYLCRSLSNRETPLTDLTESGGCVVRATSASHPASDSIIQEKLIGLFDELRIPMLRYLAGFPLTLQDSEDVIQEVFLALCQYWRNGKSHQNIRGWLFRAAHNLALKRLRSRRDIESAGPVAVEDLVADRAPNPEDQFAFSQTQRRLLSVVRAMPEQNRWCLYLRAEGLRYREIAEVLDISLGSVSLYLERSLALIARVAER